MTKISDKPADNQSEARISVAYNKNLSFVTDDKFCEKGPRLSSSANLSSWDRRQCLPNSFC